MRLLEEPFPSYLAKQTEIDDAWASCEQRFAELPSSMGDLAKQFLRSISDASGSHRAYFSSPLAPPLLYMPLWLFDGLAGAHVFPADAQPSMRSILAGTIQGYLGIRIQDDVLDDRGRADPTMLLFGNVCLSGMTLAYAQALGPVANTFWAAFDRAFVDFSRFTLEEQHAVRQDEPYALESFDEHAGKVAFARVPLLAVALLASRSDLEPLICTLINQLGIAYGIVNDVIGWTRDLRAGHRTWLLASAGLSIADFDELFAIARGPVRDAARSKLEEKLRPALYEGRLLGEALERSIQMQRRADQTALELGLAGFANYTEQRITWLENVRRQTSLIALQRALSRPGS